MKKVVQAVKARQASEVYRTRLPAYPTHVA